MLERTVTARVEDDIIGNSAAFANVLNQDLGSRCGFEALVA
jgi:hypothetical protein